MLPENRVLHPDDRWYWEETGTDEWLPFLEMSSKASVVASNRHQTSSSSSGEPRASNTSARVTNVPILPGYTHTTKAHSKLQVDRLYCSIMHRKKGYMLLYCTIVILYRRSGVKWEDFL